MHDSNNAEYGSVLQSYPMLDMCVWGLLSVPQSVRMYQVYIYGGGSVKGNGMRLHRLVHLRGMEGKKRKERKIGNGMISLIAPEQPNMGCEVQMEDGIRPRC